MKKLLIVSVILFSSFLAISNVNAYSLIVNENILDENSDTLSQYWSSSYYYFYNNSSYKSKLLNLVDTIKSNYNYYIGASGIVYWTDPDVKIFAGLVNYKDSSGNNNKFSLAFYNPNLSTVNEISYFDYIYNNKSITRTYNSEKFLTTGNSLIGFTAYGSKNYKGYYSSASNDLKSGYTYSYFSPQKYSNVSVQYNPEITCNLSNTKYTSCNYAYDTITIAGTTYNTGDYIYTDSYKYSEEIDTSNLAYIKVNYDTTGATYEDYHFSIMKNINEKINEAYIEKSYEWGICLDANTCYDNYVYRDYIEYSSDIKMYSKQSPFKFEDSDHGFYDESQELNYYYEYYDVSNISDLVELSIDSTVPFEVTFGYLEDNVDSFVILNLNGYAGLVLYPKVSIYNGDYRFDLQNANISIYQYADDKVVSKYENITEDIYYMSQIEYQDRKRFYQIVNNKINEDSYIKFNSKYFSYQLLNELGDSITIINPNTGEEEIINSIEDSENLYKISDANSLIDRVSSFLDDLSRPMIAIFDLFKYGYDRLNSTFKTFLIAAFIIILVAALIFKARGD